MEDILKNANFFNDSEKMADIKIMSKTDFLKSYSYVTEQEYDNTINKMPIHETYQFKFKT